MQSERYVDVPLFCTKALVEIACDNLGYSISANAFSGNNASKDSRALRSSINNHYSVACGSFIGGSTINDIKNLTAGLQSTHFLYNIIAYLNLKKADLLETIRINTNDATFQFNDNEFKEFLKLLMKEYPKLEVSWFSGERLLNLQLITPNSQNTLQIKVQKKLKQMDLPNILSLITPAKWHLNEFQDFNIDQDAYSYVYPIGKYYGSCIEKFYSVFHAKGFTATRNNEISDVSGETNARLSPSDLFGSLDYVNLHDIDFTNLKRLVHLTDTIFIGNSQSVANISILWIFLERNVKSTSELDFGSNAKNRLYEMYKETVMSIITEMETCVDVPSLLTSGLESWYSLYNDRLELRRNVNANARGLLPIAKDARFEAFGTLLACVREILKVSEQMEQMGYCLNDINFPSDIMQLGDTLLAHLNDVYGEKHEWFLQDDLEEYEALIANSGIAEITIKEYGDALASILKMDISPIDVIRLSPMYFNKFNTYDEDDKKDSVDGSKDNRNRFNGDSDKARASAVLSLKLKAAFSSSETVTELRTFLRDMTYANDGALDSYKIASSIQNLCESALKEMSSDPSSITQLKVILRARKYPDEMKKCVEAYILKLYTVFEFVTGFSWEFSGSDEVINKALMLQNYTHMELLYTPKSQDTSQLITKEQILISVIKQKNSPKSHIDFLFPKLRDSENRASLKTQFMSKCVSRSKEILEANRLCEINNARARTYLNDYVNVKKEILQAKELINRLYAREKSDGGIDNFIKLESHVTSMDEINSADMSNIVVAEAKRFETDACGFYTRNGVILFKVYKPNPQVNFVHAKFYHKKGAIYQCIMGALSNELMLNLKELESQLWS